MRLNPLSRDFSLYCRKPCAVCSTELLGFRVMAGVALVVLVSVIAVVI